MAASVSPLSHFRIGDRSIQPTLCRIVGPGGVVHVEPRAMDVLVALAQRAGAAVSRDELIRAVWKHPHVTDEALSRCISLLRHALGDDRERPLFVETIPKRGYRLIAAVEPADDVHMPTRQNDVRALGEGAALAYLRARYFWTQRTPDALAKSVREYEACIAREPDYAPALAGLADTLTTMALYGMAAPAALRERASDLVQRAMASDASCAETLSASAAIKLFFDWDFDVSEALLRRAIATDPSHDRARLCLAALLAFRRCFDDALRELDCAVRVDPLDLGLQTSFGQFLLYANRFDDAVAQLERTLDIGPHFSPARCVLAQAYALTGDRAAARRQLEPWSGDIPVAAFHQPGTLVHAFLGERTKAHAQLARLEASQTQRYVAPCEVARGYAALGEADAALDWIDVAIGERTPMVLGIDAFPEFDRIRDDSRFGRRLARIGLPT